jgi:predicted transcriptional regulator
MNPDSRMIRTTVYLPADLRARLREVAVGRRVSTAEVMRQALDAAASNYRPAPEGGFLRERGSE